MIKAIASLVARLTEARDAYYNGEPLMTDAAFDALEDELRKLDPDHSFFQKVGVAAPINGAWPKAHHTIPMSSLNKAQNNDELKAWFFNCGTPPEILVSEKMDGGSLAIKFHKRRFIEALTRGDGTTGEDVTRNALLVKSIIKVLPSTLPDGRLTPDDVTVRGEIVCLKSDFKTHFPDESNTRNTANGTIKRQSDSSKCAYLTFVAYQFLPNGLHVVTKTQEFVCLKAAGFRTPNKYVCRGIADITKIYNDYITAVRAGLDYDIDGLVLDVNDTYAREQLGILNKRPKGSVAYKWPQEKKATILRDIIWQVGNSGRITPVAVFDKVDFAGVAVGRASLAGHRQIKHMRLFKNCRILVARRNEVIPRVEMNLDEGIENDV